MEVKQSKVIKPETLRDIPKGIDPVISTTDFSRQKDGATSMGIDYRTLVNLLEETQKSGAKHFVYVSGIDGHKYRNLIFFEVKVKLVEALKFPGLNYMIVRSNGFFPDMKNFLQKAKSGRIHPIGSGNQKSNPIHGKDLARTNVDALGDRTKESTIGGSDVLGCHAIGKFTPTTLKMTVRTVHLPDWPRKPTPWFLTTFTSITTYGEPRLKEYYITKTKKPKA